MGNLIERLRAKAALTVKPHAPHLAGDVKHYVYDANTRALLTEAAAALEAAREDAERYRWLRETRQGRAPGNRMNPAFVKIEFYHHAPGVIGDGPTLDAAIDQARGKGAAVGKVDMMCAGDAVVVDQLPEADALRLNKQYVRLVPVGQEGKS